MVAARPSRVWVAAFPDERSLETALAALLADGYSEETIGLAIRHGGMQLLSVRADDLGPDETDQRLLAAGASLVTDLASLPAHYGPAPHPGVREDHDMKLPMGREFPESFLSPDTAGRRVPPPSVDPRARVRSFAEVEPGYSLLDALAEADRCLNCPEPACIQACPGHQHIPDFLARLREQDFAGAASILYQVSAFPAICSRVCDKTRQCEGGCVLGHEGGDPVAIGLLERFVADWDVQSRARMRHSERRRPPTGQRVAIVGSGPSGLAAAQHLALQGHQVTIFEALPVIGGALAWGIPTFRLPKQTVDAEIEYLRALGVEFQTSTKVGTDVSIDGLLNAAYDAVYIGVGATVPIGLGIPGEDLAGIYTSTEFLSRAKLAPLDPSASIQPPAIGKRLAVIGAGNTAMDVAQTAVRLTPASLQELSSKQAAMDVAETAARLGFAEVTIVYRRSEADMPARREEIRGAREEGVRFRFLTAPIRFIGEAGHVRGMQCVEMSLERRGPGRPEPVPKPGSEFVLEVDTVVLALGYKIDPSLVASSDLRVGPSGAVVIDPESGRTSRAGLWAGGDIVSGPDTVVRAMVAGRRAAADIDTYLGAAAA